MAVREVLVFPDKRLKRVCQTVNKIDETILALVQDMQDTLESYPYCVGLAAPQINSPLHIVIIDVSRNRKPVENSGRLVLINPIIFEQHGAVSGREGCLSLPHLTANVIRASKIKLKADSISGETLELEASGFEARVILHEVDHLDGILFLDRVSSLKTDIFRRKRF